MDEAGVRALLARVADDPAPPSRVDIAAARQRGRRRIRWHRAALAAAPLAAAAAVALVVSGVIPASLGFGPGRPAARPGDGAQPVQPAGAVRRVRLAAGRLLDRGGGCDAIRQPGPGDHAERPRWWRVTVRRAGWSR